MRITILTVGSRGDVQPYAALARRLMEAGHEVTLATHERFQWLGDALALPVRGLKQDPLLEFGRILGSRSQRFSGASWRALKQRFSAALDEWDAAVAGADFLVAHPKIFVAPELALRHGASVAFADTLPVSCPTSAFPCCYLLGRSWGPLANRVSYSVLPTALAPLERWAIEWFQANGSRGLPPGRRFDLFHRDGTPVAHLHGHSQAVLPAPSEWPPEWCVTGYWQAAVPDTWAPEAGLADFLANGAPPVYVGFGSMVYRGDRKRLTRDLVGPLVERGERVLLVRGWALDEADVAGVEGVYFMDSYEGPWHSWLFDRVRVVVHHGGPGTFGAALHAGVPQICCPFAMDQPFWARRAAELGVAPAPLPMRSWSDEGWASRVTAVLDDASYGERAAAMARHLEAEDGLGVAVECIENIARGRLPRPGRPG